MKSANKTQSGFLTMLKNVFRRNILLLILTQSGISFLSLIMIANSLEKKPEITSDITLPYSSAASIIIVIFSIIISFISAFCLYGELFSKRSSDFLFSMPVKREAYFNANIIFGTVNIALSYVIMFAASVFCIKSDTIFPSKFYIFDIKSFAMLLLISFLASVAVFAIFIACASISGRKWHYFILSYFAVAGAYNMALGASSYVDSIWGFMLENDYSFISSPISALFISIDYKLNHSAVLIIAFAVQAAVAYAIGLIAFKRRKAEVAETTVFGKILPFVIITIFLFSEAVVTLNFADKFYSNLMFAAVIMIIATLIITAIFYRKPFNKLTLSSLITSFALTVVLVCCVQFVPKATGYVDYVPEIGEIESVTLKTGEAYKENDSFGFLADFIFEVLDYKEDNKTFNFTTDEAKSAVLELHKKVAPEEAMKSFYNSIVSDYDYDATNGIRIEYKLKNGKTVVRTYSVSASMATNEFANIINTEECLNQIEPMIYGNDIIFFTIDKFDTEPFDPDEDYEEEEDVGYNTSSYGDYVHFEDCVKLDDYSTLLECIKKDALAAKDFRFLYDNGFDTTIIKFDEDTDEPEYYYGEDYDYGEDLVYSLTFYKFNEEVSAEEKEKMLKMVPNEMLSYNEKKWAESNYIVDSYLDEYILNIRKTDKNTLSFLEKLGY